MAFVREKRPGQAELFSPTDDEKVGLDSALNFAAFLPPANFTGFFNVASGTVASGINTSERY